MILCAVILSICVNPFQKKRRPTGTRTEEYSDTDSGSGAQYNSFGTEKMGEIRIQTDDSIIRDAIEKHLEI